MLSKLTDDMLYSDLTVGELLRELLHRTHVCIRSGDAAAAAPTIDLVERLADVLTSLPEKVVRIDETRTDETRAVETTLRDAGFLDVDAYRVNSAVICIRVVDPQFAGLTREQRLLSIEPHLEQLPESTQVDILTITAITPDEPGIP